MNNSIQKNATTILVPSSKEDLIGKQFLIRIENNVYKCGDWSKLSNTLEGRTDVVTITGIEDNYGSDKDIHPYIVTAIK